MDISETIFKIQKFCIHDGPGIRTTLFFQGCPLSCVWCHNPESQPFNKQNGSPPALEKMADYLIKEVEKDRVFYDQSKGGVTFSGGEPLCHPDLVSLLAERCKDGMIHTCLDTSGYAPLKVFAKVINAVDLVLFDVKLLNDALHLKYTGCPSGPVLENLRFLSQTGQKVLIRFPMIPGITDTPDNLKAVIRYLLENTEFKKIHILPFHSIAAGKYQRLGIPNPAENIPVPDKEDIAQVAGLFAQNGFDVKIGG